MEEALAGSSKQRASARLAVLRTDHSLCDACILVEGETFPIHLNIVAEVSPVFKAALCGDFTEGMEKSMTLTDSSSGVMNVILDYAYGIGIFGRIADFELCLKVMTDAHMYQITGLRDMASTFTMQKFSNQHIVPMVQNVDLCGLEKEKKVAYLHLAERIVDVANQSPSFGELSFDQLLSTLLCKELIATEDAMLAVVMKWLEQNSNLPTEKTRALFACIRLERLTSMTRIEDLFDPGTFPPELIVRATQLCFKKL